MPFQVSLRVFLSGALLLFLELLLFRVLTYVTHYLESMLIIAYTLCGVALGGLLAARSRRTEAEVFAYAMLGTWIFLLLALTKILRFPSLGVDNLVLVGLFAFPAAYLASAFRQFASGKVYLLDLAGGGFSLFLLVAAYQICNLEMILLGTLLTLAVAGWLASRSLRRPGLSGLMLVLSGLSLTAVGYQAQTRKLDLFYLITPSDQMGRYKIFGGNFQKVASFDSLVSRVDIVRPLDLNGPRYHYVSSGVIQDGFRPDYPPRYRRDPRLVGNLVPEPKIFIIGASAQGILKTARYLTRPEYILGSEVNPSVYRLMTEEFFQDSGYAYAGLDIRLGNALAILSSGFRRYDVITLMNTHSAANMFLAGPPDWLHTQEAYELYWNRLTPQGYLMIEERPMEPPSQQILERQIATLYAALQRQGVADPSRHFFVYSWNWNRSLRYRKFMPMIFTSLLVSREPLGPSQQLRLQDWVRVTGFRWAAEGKRYTQATPAEKAASAVRFHFLPGVAAEPRYQALFESLRKGTLDPESRRWDYSPVTDDRPFSSQVDRQLPEVKQVIFSCAWLLALLSLPLILSLKNCANKTFHASMMLYQAGVGFAYILLEVVLMQLYQKHILSPTLAFGLVLAVLLVSSGLGGRLLCQRPPAIVLTALALSLAGHFFLSRALLTLRLSSAGLVLAIASATALSGFLMGAFLPLGMERARRLGHESQLPEYFAANSLGGTLALALSLYLPIVYGFQATAVLALAAYLAALVVLKAAPAGPC